MDTSLLLDNLLSPPILFFALGVLAVLVGSDLEIPQPMARFLSLYLLFAIGLHGGHALHRSGVTMEVVTSLLVAMLLAVAVPVYTFFLLRLRLGVPDAAAVAATYGSVSAVTFVTAGAFLQQAGVSFGGHMVAAMALMESPAIIIGVLFHRHFAARNGKPPLGVGHLLRDACFNGSVLLIVGSLVIGLVSGDRGWAAVSPFADGIFRGMLSFFLLDMGLVAARQVRDLPTLGWWLPAFAVGVPVVNAAVAIGLARLGGVPMGDAMLLAVLAASASYLAVPAAMRLAIPEANPGLYVSMSLGVTFPFNIVLGLPLYLAVVRALWG